MSGTKALPHGILAQVVKGMGSEVRPLSSDHWCTLPLIISSSANWQYLLHTVVVRIAWLSTQKALSVLPVKTMWGVAVVVGTIRGGICSPEKSKSWVHVCLSHDGKVDVPAQISPLVWTSSVSLSISLYKNVLANHNTGNGSVSSRNKGEANNFYSYFL